MKIFRSNSLWSSFVEVYTETCCTKRDRIKLVLGNKVGFLSLKDAAKLSRVLSQAIESRDRIRDGYRCD